MSWDELMLEADKGKILTKEEQEVIKEGLEKDRIQEQWNTYHEENSFD